jgi:hypothetical protein
MSPTGSIREVRTPNGAVIQHVPGGGRIVEAARPGGRVVVAANHGPSFVQRRIMVNHQPLVQRTYVAGGATYVRVYRPVTYGRVALNVYMPARYYRPAFYIWAGNPWPRPVLYSWGWGASPWYSYYGGYFTPYPVYASPAAWLTDYVVASTLQAAYQERMDDRAAYQVEGNNFVASPAPMTTEIKQMIADDIRNEMERQRAESANAGNPASTQDSAFTEEKPHEFLVPSRLTVESGGQECTVEPGDVLQLAAAPPLNSSTADVVVLSTRGHGCGKGSVVAVQLQDLQEMRNTMVATLEKGQADLQARQGQGGIPAMPRGTAGIVNSSFAGDLHPDSDAIGEIAEVSLEAGRAERDVLSQSGQIGLGAPGPIKLRVGLTIEQVVALQGQPDRMAEVGNKKIYIYGSLKITFINGKVTDIE